MFCLLTVWFIWEGPDSVSKFLAAELVGGCRLASRVPDFILSAHFCWESPSTWEFPCQALQQSTREAQQLQAVLAERHHEAIWDDGRWTTLDHAGMFFGRVPQHATAGGKCHGKRMQKVWKIHENPHSGFLSVVLCIGPRNTLDRSCGRSDSRCGSSCA